MADMTKPRKNEILRADVRIGGEAYGKRIDTRNFMPRTEKTWRTSNGE
jgi:hypothetical protein